ncbi:ParA family protein [Geothrix sp. PMB-07]|uniref:ParA family protein n=1 Tax=Geothrix sp. PMB-07 TaxID=3068640 RepID=UPI0027407985|nr:ParA family protein [Geothrix sp. PMB-07]WLT32769.1 ParA family protein [Geothrix sp. PMB-07]
MLISLINLKGGSGKTTYSKELAALLAEFGLLAKGLDLNPENGDFGAWAELATLPCRSLYPADLGLLEQAAKGKQTYIADCPPWEGEETRTALAYSAGILVPVGPSPQDLRGLGRTLDLVRAAKANANPELRVAILGTNYRANTGWWRSWAAAVEAAASPEEGIFFAGLVQERQGLVDAFGRGVAACQQPNAAGVEVREAMLRVVEILGLGIPAPVVQEVL